MVVVAVEVVRWMSFLSCGCGGGSVGCGDVNSY